MTSPGATAVVAWAVIGAAVGAAAGLGSPRLLEASCRPRLPVLVVAISAGTSICFGLLAVNFDGVELAAFSFLAAAGVLVSAIDLLERRIPSRVVLPAYVVVAGSLVNAAAERGSVHELARACGASALLAVSYLLVALASRGQLGSGDVKFSGLLGLAMGWLDWTTVLAGTVTAWLGAATYLVLLRLLHSPAGTVAMAPFLLGGAVLALTVL